MSKVFFMNNGDFDVRAMITMGVSAKPENSVGFFGTGFKYAVAIVLRLGGSLKISTLSGVYEFTASRETIRDKEFDIVYMNGREAGFTTHLGVNWEPWMAYRGLYCNAKDEGGITAAAFSPEYDTIIEVDCPDIALAHKNTSQYFLQKSPVYPSPYADIHNGGKPFVYYKGIAIKNSYDDMLFSYNIQSEIDLTEDRTVKYEYQVLYAITKTIQKCMDKSILRKCLHRGNHFEAKLNYALTWGYSDEFIEVCEELVHSDLGLCETARTLLSTLRDNMGDWPEFEMSTVQKKMLDRAKGFLCRIDIPVGHYPVKTVKGMGNGVMGRALDGVIYLSEEPFNMGTKQVASTLLEEWVHNKYGVEDFDRGMQSWLFDKILSLGENINQEPI